MSANEGPSIKDVILKQYELTDTYHDRKAHSAWIASTVYFAFSIGFISIWNPYSNSAAKIVATVICIGLYTGAMSFISLQFSHRWTAVVRTGMYNWLFEKKWNELKTSSDYVRLQRKCQNREKRRQRNGLTKSRKVLDIIWMTILLPILLAINIVFLALAKKSVKDIDCEIKRKKAPRGSDSEDIKRLYRQKRRRVSGLIDTKYRTEIPAYTISLYFFVAQILLIWLPCVFTFTAKR